MYDFPYNDCPTFLTDENEAFWEHDLVAILLSRRRTRQALPKPVVRCLEQGLIPPCRKARQGGDMEAAYERSLSLIGLVGCG
jgi:hypothetical protein